MPPSTSRSSTNPETRPPTSALGLQDSGIALTVDVEEWFHNCWVPEYVDPRRRPPLAFELDALLPAMLDGLARIGARATFFFLGEVAQRSPHLVRATLAAGHEIACHGYLHYRATERRRADFVADLVRAKSLLEQLIGEPVRGYRAPEWSLRAVENPWLNEVAAAGFLYDSSLAPAWGAGAAHNPRRASALALADGATLLEIPPLVWGGRLRLPAGGWCGRNAPQRTLLALARRERAAGAIPTFVVHPWECVSRPIPGVLTGLARFLHDCGRERFAQTWPERFRPFQLQPISEILSRNGWGTGLGRRVEENAA